MTGGFLIPEFPHCSNVLVAGLNLQNAHFWTNHLYQCDYVKYLNCRIYSPASPIKAPSTDAIDIDVCHDVLMKNCYLEVNDDSIVLKGGKGPWADTAPENGINERVLVEDCIYGFCHGCLTCGSESVHNKNIIVRRIKVLDGNNLLWLKMRPDTPQHYEYILMEDIPFQVRVLHLTCFSDRALFQKNNRALKGLLGSLLHMQPEEILSVEIMNPIVIGEAIQDKEFRLDIKAVLNNYQQINLEMQVVNYHDWPERSIGYRTAQDLQ